VPADRRPVDVDEKQLRELHIRLRQKVETQVEVDDATVAHDALSPERMLSITTPTITTSLFAGYGSSR
jgi:hypothetical protein